MVPYLCLLVVTIHIQMIRMLLKCFLFFRPMQYMCVYYTYTYMCTNIFLCVWGGLAYAQGITDMT